MCTHKEYVDHGKWVPGNQKSGCCFCKTVTSSPNWEVPRFLGTKGPAKAGPTLRENILQLGTCWDDIEVANNFIRVKKTDFVVVGTFTLW
jgi:hypothetical protein